MDKVAIQVCIYPFSPWAALPVSGSGIILGEARTAGGFAAHVSELL